MSKTLMTGDTGQTCRVKQIRGPQRHCEDQYNKTEQVQNAREVSYIALAIKAQLSLTMMSLGGEMAMHFFLQHYWVIIN